MKILFGVFDWGLGHATRDIPLIGALLREGHEVHIISTGRALAILRDNFKNKCKFHDVPGIYQPHPRNRFFQTSVFISAPKIISSYRRGRKISESIIKREKFDKVISDCRFDVYDIPENSYLINHQLRLKTFFGAERIMERLAFSRLRKFGTFIVPDFEDKNLSGRLSHGLRYIKKEKINYIGIISQLNKKKVKPKIDYFFSISGPGPQRAIFEKKILSQISKLKGKIVITAGNPEERIFKRIAKNVDYYSYLNKKEQESMMNKAKVVVSRSGYTTMMEIAELNKNKVLLVSTPGQTEQEYLAGFYEKHGHFHHIPQHKMNLTKNLLELDRFKGFTAPWKTKESIKKFLEAIYA